MTSKVFGREVNARFPVAVSGRGLLLTDADGRTYLDASGGAAVSCLGHGHPEIAEAIKRQVDAIAYAHTGTFSNAPQEALAEMLVRHAPAGISHAFFATSGSEAVEAALKLARQYHVERGEAGRHRVIFRQSSYHGNTLGALAVSGHRGRRAIHEPMLVQMPSIDRCFAWRDSRPGESEADYGRRVADTLETRIMELGAETVSAFIAEPVVGATIGAVPAVPGYFKGVREICDRHGVLLILDEVMCGMGRTGTLHACEQDGIAPDLLTMAKGLGAGYQPIGAVLVARRIHDALAGGSGAFNHGHTYMGHAVGCAAALAVQQVIQRDGLVARVRAAGDRLAGALADRLGDHPHVGDLRGRGLVRGIELVADRQDRVPFAAEQRLHRAVHHAALERGLMCYPSGGTVDGIAGDHILLAPPYIVTDGQVDEIVDRMAAAIDDAVAAVRR